MTKRDISRKKTKNMNTEQKYIDFEAYERVAEPHKRERVSAWRTAIGLQDAALSAIAETQSQKEKHYITGLI